MFLFKCKSCNDVFGLTNRKRQCKCRKSAGKQTSCTSFSISGRSIIYEIPDRVIDLYEYTGEINVIIDNFSEKDIDWKPEDGGLYKSCLVRGNGTSRN